MKQPDDITLGAGLIDHELRHELIAHKAARNLTNRDLSRAFGAGADGTRVSKYLNGRPDGDWETLQARARDFLQSEKKKAALAPTELRQTLVSKMCFGLFELTRKLSEFALVHGNAGVGKSCAVALYAQQFPNTLTITASEWCKHESAVVGAIVDAYGAKGWDRQTPRGKWLVDRMRGTGRLLIVDNAQRLTVVIVGNPDVLDKLKSSDQLFSRIQAAHPVGFTQVAEAEQFAAQLLKDLLPAGEGELTAEVTELLIGYGAARRVRMQLALTREFLSAGEYRDVRKAFAAARLKMVTKGGR